MPPLLDLTGQNWEKMREQPRPANEGLIELFNGVDSVVIKDGGVSGDKALTDKIVLTITDPGDIDLLCKALKVDENDTGFHCMCLGSYAIELLSGNELKATIGLHHGDSIRYNKWNGDATLADNKCLLDLLAALGFERPGNEWLEDQLAAEERRSPAGQWIEHAPRSFKKYKQELMNDNADILPLVAADLETEYPDKNKRIVALLDIFGRTENYWTAFQTYELVPYTLLRTYAVDEVIAAYNTSKRNYKTRKGLGRFLCFQDFKSHRRQYLHCLDEKLLDELLRCFREFGNITDIGEITRLQKEWVQKNTPPNQEAHQ